LFFFLFEFRNGTVALQHIKFFVEELKRESAERIALCVLVFASPNESRRLIGGIQFPNAAIASQTSHSEKVIENTVSRSAQVFGIKSDGETNLRVLLALAYRTHYGDKAFDKLHVACSHYEVGADGQSLCNRHID